MAKIYKDKTLFGKIIYKIGYFFNNVQKSYDKLAAAEQVAIKKSSMFIALVTQTEAQTPEFVFEAMKLAFPEFSKEEFDKVLNTIGTKITEVGSLVGATPEGTLTNIAQYLNKFQGKDWAKKTQDAVIVLIQALKPGGSLLSKLLPCLEFVYRTFVVKEVGKYRQA